MKLAISFFRPTIPYEESFISYPTLQSLFFGLFGEFCVMLRLRLLLFFAVFLSYPAALLFLRFFVSTLPLLAACLFLALPRLILVALVVFLFLDSILPSFEREAVSLVLRSLAIVEMRREVIVIHSKQHCIGNLNAVFQCGKLVVSGRQ